MCLSLITILSFQYSFGQRLDTKEKRGKFALTADKKRVTDYAYDYVQSLEREYAVVLQGKAWGLINDRGEEVLPIEYDQLVFAAENKLIAEKDGVFGVIDYAGKAVVPFRYENIQQYYTGGTALVKENGQWGVLRQGVMSSDLSKVVFRQPDVYPLFAGTDLSLGTQEERQLDSAAKLIKFLTEQILNLAIEDLEGLKDLKGDAEVVFVITPHGKVKSARVVKGIGGDVGRVILGIIKEMPDWSVPPQANGQPVAMEFKMPIELNLKVFGRTFSR